jgi:hypothetical protein
MKLGIRLLQTGNYATPENMIYIAETDDKSGFSGDYIVIVTFFVEYQETYTR